MYGESNTCCTTNPLVIIFNFIWVMISNFKNDLTRTIAQYLYGQFISWEQKYKCHESMAIYTNLYWIPKHYLLEVCDKLTPKGGCARHWCTTLAQSWVGAKFKIRTVPTLQDRCHQNNFSLSQIFNLIYYGSKYWNLVSTKKQYKSRQGELLLFLKDSILWILHASSQTLI